MLDPLDARSLRTHVRDHDDIETHAHPREVSALLKKLGGCAHYSPLLATVDASRCSTVRPACASADLNYHENVALARNDIELTEPAAVVSFQDLESLGAQEVRSDILRHPSNVLPKGVHPCAPGSLCRRR
jgi:hypothetical protein